MDQLSQQTRYLTARRLYLPLSSRPENYDKRLSCQLESIDSFVQAYPTESEQTNLIEQLESIVLTEDLLADHRRLQKVLFPAIAADLFEDRQWRLSSMDLQMFTYPEHFALVCDTPERRQAQIAATETRIAEQSKAENEAQNKWINAVRKLTKRHEPEP